MSRRKRKEKEKDRESPKAGDRATHQPTKVAAQAQVAAEATTGTAPAIPETAPVTLNQAQLERLRRKLMAQYH